MQMQFDVFVRDSLPGISRYIFPNLGNYEQLKKEGKRRVWKLLLYKVTRKSK